MGMYDEIICQYPLPGKPPREVLEKALSGELQTKSFDCLMEKYTITTDGSLLKTEFDTEIVPEEERYYYGKPEWDKGEFYRACGMLQRTPRQPIGIDFHGDISFYTTANDYRDFYCYTARFTDGRLMWIRATDPTN